MWAKGSLDTPVSFNAWALRPRPVPSPVRTPIEQAPASNGSARSHPATLTNEHEPDDGVVLEELHELRQTLERAGALSRFRSDDASRIMLALDSLLARIDELPERISSALGEALALQHQMIIRDVTTAVEKLRDPPTTP